ncbi:hypothetical protein I5L01_15330, partial [Erythrobacter sp. YJ-T3-07]|uniref:hypothetical protein n=1 Tax=Erythrobacter sp. YJ-T3-07 TaxID=2793063 RepID=UPI0018D3E280
LPSAQEQLSKHRKGNYEWVLTLRVPKRSLSNTTNFTALEPPQTCDTIKLCFGCNLYPEKPPQEPESESAKAFYTLLVTPLQIDGELDAATELNEKEKAMAVTLDMTEQATPAKSLAVFSEVTVKEVSPSSTKTEKDNDSFSEPVKSVSPSVLDSGIENPIDALDKLEEELEA